MDVKVHFICMLVFGESLHQFDLLSTYVENTDTSLTVDYLIKGLAWHFPPVKFSFNTNTCNVCMYEKTTQLKSKAI